MNAATALALTAGKPTPLVLRGFEVAIASEPVRVAQIRRITAAFMRRWALPVPLAQDVAVVVSELVTNAIKHGTGAVALRMRLADGNLLIEVTDGNPAPARLCAAKDDDLCGRGLFLVASLSENWGVSDDGRTTWATFYTPGSGQ